MTAETPNLSSASASHDDAEPDTPVTIARGDRAEIIVWRTAADRHDDPDMDALPDISGSPLTPRLARHLVAIYSGIHATVIDLDADVNLRDAAESAGRTYTAAADANQLATAASEADSASLIVLRWPRPASVRSRRNTHSLMTICRQHLPDHGSIIIVIPSATTADTGFTNREHQHTLRGAARDAGLLHLHDIVALDAKEGTDTFTYATAPTTPDRNHNADNTRQNAGTILTIFGHAHRNA